MIEFIDCAAIKWRLKGNKGNGNIIKGPNHARCIEVFSIMDLYQKDRDLRFEKQGFLTNTGRFVDRKEAYSIARKADQLTSDRCDGILYSEYCDFNKYTHSKLGTPISK